MEKRTALASAGAITATVLTAAIALGANTGLFGLATADDGPGTAHLVDARSKVQETKTVEVPVPESVPPAAPSTAGAPRPPTVQSPGTSDEMESTQPTADDDHSDDAYSDDAYSDDLPEHEDDD